jgi:hypothetical protein
MNRWLNGGFHGAITNITLTFFPNYSKPNAFSYTKAMDYFENKKDYLFAMKQGCCHTPTYFELSTFPENITFLKCHQRIYEITIPDSKNTIYLGYYLTQPEDSTPDIYGILYYSVSKQLNGTVVFKTKSENSVKQIYKIELFSNSPADYEDGTDTYTTTLHAFSLKGKSLVNSINNVGINITFYGMEESEGKQKEYKLEFVKGKIAEKEIVIEF